MNKFKSYALLLFILSVIISSGYAQSSNESYTVVRPKMIDDVLANPGMGFMTFQRFNGDDLNTGQRWTEGFPIDYQNFDGNLENQDYPVTTIAYWRIYWKFIEPEEQKYNWEMLDKALEVAESRGQSLMLRIAPYGSEGKADAPDWYREKVGENKTWAYSNPVNKWLVDPEDPNYVKYFGGLIRAMGARYDGHPALEAVDLSIVGAWGEGAGSELLTQNTMEALIDAYTESFTKTPLIALLMDEKTNRYANSKIKVGWRVDCLGDLGFWAKHETDWNHMFNFYPREIIGCDVQESWRNSPVSLEICGTFLIWRDRENYNRDDVQYIFDQALKWHISSFNAKSSPVPEEWKDLVEEWLKRMGYRFALRQISFPTTISKNEKFKFYSWWENKGVAPCYKDFIPAFRLKSEKSEAVMAISDFNLKEWLPGDIIFDDSFFVPSSLPEGNYRLEIALVDRINHRPRVNLAIEGKTVDGWYPLGEVKVTGTK